MLLSSVNSVNSVCGLSSQSPSCAINCYFRYSVNSVNNFKQGQQCQQCKQHIARCYLHLWWYFYVVRGIQQGRSIPGNESLWFRFSNYENGFFPLLVPELWECFLSFPSHSRISAMKIFIPVPKICWKNPRSAGSGQGLFLYPELWERFFPFPSCTQTDAMKISIPVPTFVEKIRGQRDLVRACSQRKSGTHKFGWRCCFVSTGSPPDFGLGTWLCFVQLIAETSRFRDVRNWTSFAATCI